MAATHRTRPSRALAGAALLALLGGAAGCKDTLPESPHALWIEPDNGPTDMQLTVTIHGKGFAVGVMTDFQNPGASEVSHEITARFDEFDLIGAHVVDGDTIEAMVPAGLPMGRYSLVITDRLMRTTRLPAAFTVRETTCTDADLPGGGVDCTTCGTIRGCTCGETSCVPRCGDGLRRDPEKCDDGNTEDDDGCSAGCVVERGFVCAGEPSRCSADCGDGVQTGVEDCDDGNLVDGDGCSHRCTIDYGYTCTSTAPHGLSTCGPLCGDGELGPGERCDDHNTIAGDGCTADCRLELGFICRTAGQPCETICGDGIIAGAETCDDGNTRANDGCDATCHLEHGFTCPAGGVPCFSTCGDGLRAAGEGCDDGNTRAGDGCSNGCTLELGFDCPTEGASCAAVCGDGRVVLGEGCDDGDRSSGDGCSSDCQVEAGYRCPTAGSACEAICGDGRLLGAEACDDGNTTPGDGCSPTCAIEAGFECPTANVACTPVCGDGRLVLGEACDDGNLALGDGCSPTCTLESGWTCGGGGAACTPVCGDGRRLGDEACDDGNAAAGDGCSATCAVERGFTCATPGQACTTTCGDGLRVGQEACDDANLTDGDGCSSTCAVESGWTCAVAGRACSPICGDGRLLGNERCDDGNSASGDGCSSACAIETGFYCTSPGHPCTTQCGDGRRASIEDCDDGNLTNGDGCSAICGLEPGYSCPTPGAPCGPTCGDGLRVGNEPCDDGNLRSGDGCSITCAIEPGWACPTAGQACTPVCGDGLLTGTETCDDLNASSGDGCSSSCRIETGWACDVVGVACLPICGDGRVLGVETCDDSNLTNGDGCSAACAIELGWVCPNLPGQPCHTVCGDGVVAGTERCDDGNLNDGDGCDHTCTPACGNGTFEPQYGEQCDDGNGVNADGCEADCTLPRCGNAIADPGEECDDGNALEGDGCDSNCTASRCGNGILSAGEECDDGNSADLDGCQADCTYTHLTAPINADGVYRTWTPSGTTVDHWRMLTPGCTGATYLWTSAVGRRESFNSVILNVPPGGVITDVEVTPCASSYTGAAGSFSVFLRVDDVQTADSAPYTVSGTSPSPLSPTVFHLQPELPRANDSTLDVGLVYTGGTGGVRLGGLSVVVRYYVRPFPAPTDLVATHSGLGDVHLAWTDNTTWETGFEIDRSVEYPDVWQIVANTVVASLATFDDRFLPEDQTIYYRVRAIDGTTTAQSPFGNTARVITASHVPKPPQNAFLDTSVAGVTTLRWIDSSFNEEGFVIERRVDGGAFAEVTRTDLNVTSWDTPACPGTVCEYRLHAWNAIGDSPSSNVASPVVAPTTGPDVRLTVTGNHSSVVGTQRTDFTFNYTNQGDATVSKAWIVTTVPPDTTFIPGRSGLDWMCHHPAADQRLLTITIGRVLRAIRVKFPNAKQVLISSHNWAGYAPIDGGLCSPFDYEAGFAVKRAVAAQIHQMRTGEIDPLVGDLSYQNGRAPWATWAFYYWANGTTPNGLGIYWPITDFQSDLTHMNENGRPKVGQIFVNHLLSMPWTYWYRTITIPQQPILPVTQPPNMIPLIDMLPGQKYLGFEGGLYDNYSNQIPADHLAAGMAAAGQLQPLDMNGNPSSNGLVIMTGLGYSNSAQAMVALIDATLTDLRAKPLHQADISSTFEIVNGAGGGGVASAWAQLDSAPYQTLHGRLGQGMSENQIQVVWFNSSNNANMIVAHPTLLTAAGTVCRAPLGDIAPGATRNLTFSVSSAFTTSTPIEISARIEDDGTGGTDRTPADNRATFSYTPSLCPALNAPGCDPCAAPVPPVCDDGNPANGVEVCVPNVGCVSGSP